MADAGRGEKHAGESEPQRRPGERAFGVNAQRFSGKVAIVTGAAAGIGAAIAAQLAAEGATVVLADVNAAAAERRAEELRDAGESAFAVAADVTSPESVDALVRAVLDRAGAIHVLVNNAGIIGPVAALADYPVADWRRVLDVDLSGVFYCLRAVVPHMVVAHYGRVVNIASIAGKEGNPRLPAYAAAKAGVIGLTKSVGHELAGSGVLVNCVAPGGVDSTGILQGRPFGTTPTALTRSPLGRNAQPHEVAVLVAWLCSDECTYNAGAVFDLSGGRASY